MYNYRDRFYKQYYRSQAGRSNFNAAISDKLKIDERHFRKEIIPLIDKPLDSTTLDIGCGYGSLVYTLQKTGFKNSSGIDLSEEQVKVAGELGIQNISMEDIKTHLKAHPDTYDVITGIDIIEHFSKDELIELLDMIKVSLKKDGIAIFRTPNVDAPYSTVFYYGDFTHENFLNFSSATQLMENIGFSKIEVTSSVILIQGALKNFIRRCVWYGVTFFSKVLLFSSGRTAASVIFTPNLIIKIKK